MAVRCGKFTKTDGVIRLLRLLQTPRTLSEIVDFLDLNQRTVWRYFRELKRSGVPIVRFKEDSAFKYSLYPEGWALKKVIFKTPEGDKAVDVQDCLIVRLQE
ncbi:MAG: HTH domain-containing protein [Patescibacteria group bacterium]|nr:HTH domain-containing protein [Patescibacteria group bacterium]